MKVQYFADTDTVYVLLKENSISETRDLDENTLIDVDADGNLIGITIEHARERADITNFVFQQFAEQVTA
ncbi:MAG: DUF2283 domain-containing protein [Chloroflexi bacterium]|nr:DUF2283 domain-containing protein [Chloroflexota bacterium]